MFLVYNSDILSESDFHVPYADRAFQYGDGLFETIRYEQQQVWFWADHFDRLSAGMTALHLILPENFTAEAIHQRILALLTANHLTRQPTRIKIQVWRQAGGLYTPTQHTTNVLITARPGQGFAVTEKAKTTIFDSYRLAPSPVSVFKTLNALPYVLAGIHKQQTAVDEVILLDTTGNVAECLSSNLFWFADQTLYTPSLQTGCINGILRRQLLRLASGSGISVIQGHYPPKDILRAEAVFCANVMGIQWLRSIDNVSIPATASPESNVVKLLNALFAQLHS
ncbi:aminotransferase class IV [Spirosoma sp.]|uniref:aminotransferase class IV n=1 Tax=Spirosoma sp. TaxID=1899569 RepID=UPI003B3BD53D